MGNNAGPESKRGTGKRKMCIFVLLAKKITIFLCVFSSFSFSHCSCFDFRPFLSGSLFFPWDTFPVFVFVCLRDGSMAGERGKVEFVYNIW